MTTNQYIIGDTISFDFEGETLTGEIIELYRYPQPCGEETDEDYYTYDMVVEVDEELFDLSADNL